MYKVYQFITEDPCDIFYTVEKFDKMDMAIAFVERMLDYNPNLNDEDFQIEICS